MKAEHAGYSRRVLILKKEVLLASLPQSSIGQKSIAGLKN
jgi:hypothetical protein